MARHKETIIPGNILNPYAWSQRCMDRGLKSERVKYLISTGEVILIPSDVYEFTSDNSGAGDEQ